MHVTRRSSEGKGLEVERGLLRNGTLKMRPEEQVPCECPSPSLRGSLLQDVACSLAPWTLQPGSGQECVMSSSWLTFLLLALSLI